MQKAGILFYSVFDPLLFIYLFIYLSIYLFIYLFICDASRPIFFFSVWKKKPNKQKAP